MYLMQDSGNIREPGKEQAVLQLNRALKVTKKCMPGFLAIPSCLSPFLSQERQSSGTSLPAGRFDFIYFSGNCQR